MARKRLHKNIYTENKLRTKNNTLHGVSSVQDRKNAANLGRLLDLFAVSIDHCDELFKISVGSNQTKPHTVEPGRCHS